MSVGYTGFTSLASFVPLLSNTIHVSVGDTGFTSLASFVPTVK